MSDAQRQRVVSALAGAMNEIKTFPLLGGGRLSTVPEFVATVRRFFPNVRDDPDEATQLVAHLMSLRRRLERVAPPPASAESGQAGRRPWWRFWGRGSG